MTSVNGVHQRNHDKETQPIENQGFFSLNWEYFGSVLYTSQARHLAHCLPFGLCGMASAFGRFQSVMTQLKFINIQSH